MKNVFNKLKKISWFTFIIQTVIPFFIPFIFEIPAEMMDFRIKIGVMLIIAGIDLVIIYVLSTIEKDDETNMIRSHAARSAYSYMYQLNEEKRDYYIDEIASKESNPLNALPYNAEHYINEICNSFNSVISEISHIEKEHVSVTFVYHFLDTDEWRWATKKDGTMTLSLKTFIEMENTVFYQLLNKDKDGKLKTVIFYNDKAEKAKEGVYYLSTRDNRHDDIGSILGIKVGFSTNEKILVEGLFVISTYGKKIIESNDKNEIKMIQRIIIDDLFPCYQRMLETELGVLYYQRQLNNEQK